MYFMFVKNKYCHWTGIQSLLQQLTQECWENRWKKLYQHTLESVYDLYVVYCIKYINFKESFEKIQREGYHNMR